MIRAYLNRIVQTKENSTLEFFNDNAAGVDEVLDVFQRGLDRLEALKG